MRDEDKFLNVLVNIFWITITISFIILIIVLTLISVVLLLKVL